MKSVNYKNQKSLVYIESKNFTLNIIKEISKFYLLTTTYSYVIYQILAYINFTPGMSYLFALAVAVFISEIGYNKMIIKANPLTTIYLFHSRSLTIGLTSAFLSKTHEDQCFQIIQFSYFLMFSSIFIFFKITQFNIQSFNLPKFIIPYLLISSLIIPLFLEKYGVIHWVIVFVYSFPYLILFHFFFKDALKFNKIGNENSKDDRIEVIKASLYIIDVISYFRKTILDRKKNLRKYPYYIN
ncbi:hypothetical protein [Leptospira kanakyensis]|uniref:hypothetical protein n=1 Tax=Leptospira kanakyensis TaxID=2484968 RepID=UPI00223CE474|nr:hypothetical protein [Leptospira kanakyensis]MCW7471756.1 hypothetical protein [Leptospira kanakyensis]